MDQVTFESLCGETIESITEYFEELVDADPTHGSADVAYSVSSFELFSDKSCKYFP